MGGKTVSMLKILGDIVKAEGAANLYRGVWSPVFAEAPKRAIKFSLNETYKVKLRKEDGSLPALRAAVAGSMAGMTECSVNTPFEVGWKSYMGNEYIIEPRLRYSCPQMEYSKTVY